MKGSSPAHLSAAFKALGDPTRLTVFSMLRSSCGPMGCSPETAGAQRTLKDLACHLGVGLPTISHHLKELRQAGLVLCERRGRRIHCSINQQVLARMGAFLGGAERDARGDPRALGKRSARTPRPRERGRHAG